MRIVGERQAMRCAILFLAEAGPAQDLRHADSRLPPIPAAAASPQGRFGQRTRRESTMTILTADQLAFFDASRLHPPARGPAGRPHQQRSSPRSTRCGPSAGDAPRRQSATTYRQRLVASSRRSSTSIPALCALLDDPRIHGLACQILGDDFNLHGLRTGNLYAGDTACIRTAGVRTRRFIRGWRLYLLRSADPPRPGRPLRVIPAATASATATA